MGASFIGGFWKCALQGEGEADLPTRCRLLPRNSAKNLVKGGRRDAVARGDFDQRADARLGQILLVVPIMVVGWQADLAVWKDWHGC